MAIQISRNAAGNCITFAGATQPAYWNACLSAQLNSDDNTRVDIINDIRSAAQGEVFFEFYAVDPAGFSDGNGAAFATPQAMVDYVNEVGNVTGTGAQGIDLNAETTVNFRLDETSTSIIMSTGHAFGVNTIKAVPDADGTIHIQAIGEGLPEAADSTVVEKEHFQKLVHTAVQINGTAVSGGLNDVCNALNELFTAGAFTAVVIQDPYSTLVADTVGTLTTGSIVGTHGIDPTGDDIFGASSAGSLNGYKTVDTIDQAGEYFTFQIRNRGQIGFGLIASDDTYSNALYATGSNTTYINPAQFGVGNNAHYGFQFSHWFHPTPNGSWTNYGANTGYVMGQAWYSANTHFEARDEWVAGTPITIRVGINENGFIHIDSLADDGTTWKQHARTSYAVREGSAYHLGIKMGDTTVRLYSTPKVHLLEPAAPTMNFRWIESPDGVYQYPLFATEEEANYYDQNHDGSTGSGTSHTHVFADDPTNTTWYMPDTGRIMDGATAPQDALYTNFMGAAVTYTEVTSQTNADLAPPAFTGLDLTVDEGSTLNYQTQPQDTAYTTTITSNPVFPFFVLGGTITGTAPEVTGDNVANPSDTYTMTVTRTNSYGSSTGTFDLIVNNTTAPTITAVSGVAHEATSTALVDTDTLGDGSVVKLDNILDNGNRLVMDKAFVDNYVLPAINSGTGDQSVWIGFGRETGGSANWASVEASDFEVAFEFFSNDVERAGNRWRLRTYQNGVQVNNVGIGSNATGLYNYIFVNDEGTIKIAGLLPSYGDATSFVWTPSSLSWEQEVTGLATQSRDVFIGTDGTTMDLPNPFVNFTEVAEPNQSGLLTDWDKALDFSGSAERVEISNNSYYRIPQKLGNLGTTVSAPANPAFTTASSNGRPWATAIVFRADGNNSNQHIWNVGEGAGSVDDNIYLRVDSFGALYFGWGRQGAINEYLIATNLGSASWYGAYVAHNGTRLSGTDATSANLSAAFDIKLMFYSGGSWIFNPNPQGAGAGQWTSTGARMDRQIQGTLSIGGRGANRNFHGKVASFVNTSLMLNTAMPTDSEIEMMVTDPKQWLDDYKVGQSYRPNWTHNNSSNFQIGDGSSAYATQVWLMGDGTSDAYSNGIRNQAAPNDSTYTKLNFVSMVSNDIETVNIPGLS